MVEFLSLVKAMNSSTKRSFIKAIKSKVIIAFLLACCALFLAWGVSKMAFQEMLSTVDNISAPSERLRLVNVISRKLGSLDQIQKNKAFNDPGNYRKLFKESVNLKAALDTLGTLYSDDSTQLARIATIRRLLRERDKQFINYLKVRERLVNNKSFSAQVQNLNDILAKSSSQLDSTVLATEEKTSTTTIYPTEKKNRGFFSKLFGKKQPEQDNSYKIVSEEKVKRDTIALSAEEKMAQDLKQSLKIIEQDQREKNASFLNKEAVLANANSLLVNQMLDVLRKVEAEVVNQIRQNGVQAKAVVNTGITNISLIMLVFVVLTGLLLYFILTDISRSGKYRNELEKARDEAEYHGRAKQRFLSNMSHEIRTPLQSIIGYSEIIRNQQHPQRKDIEAIYQSSEHLLQIVNEVLDYNRIISGKFTFSKKPFHVQHLLDEVISVMRPQAELKSLLLNTNFDLKGVDYVEGDAFRLKQILYNLIGNAVKFTNTGEVQLSAFYKKQANNLHFTFIVKDTGIGISEKEIDRVFNEFEQVAISENEVLNSTGTGLGLPIIKSLIEQQGGRVYVKSKVGEGSVFTTYLTFSIGNRPQYEETKTASGGLYSQDKIWIVDDDQLILDLCAVILEKNGLKYKCFSSPFSLLNAEWDPAVKYVLMDMRMPQMDGIELCLKLRERVKEPIKIYAITAQVLPDEREFLLENGFDGIVMKPFREGELLAVFNLKTDMNAETIEYEKPDLASLRKMVFNDQEQLNKIISRFKIDCAEDIAEIRLEIGRGRLDKLRLLTHRLAGRVGQIGSRNLGMAFRSSETELRKANELDDQNKAAIYVLINRLENLMVNIDAELEATDYSIS